MHENHHPVHPQDASDLEDSAASGQGSQSVQAAMPKESDSELDEEAAYERLLDRMDEDIRRMRAELIADQAALERRRWWVIGPRTAVF